MTHLEIVRYRMRLDNLFTKYSQLSHDAELIAHWSRYLCVLLSGFIELSVQVIFREYSRNKSAPNVYNYVESKLEGFQNPKMGKILELTASFNTQWLRQLETEVEGEIKDAIDSIVNIRNQIAHGKDVGITPSILKDYYIEAKRFVNILDRQCHARQRARTA